MIGRSNITRASCSQGAITHRIPLFAREAIAKWAPAGNFAHSLGRSKGKLPNCRFCSCEKHSMISIQSSLTELERSHQIRDEVLDCYVLAIKNIAHYAVELDEEITGSHRKYLETLATEVAAGTSEALAD